MNSLCEGVVNQELHLTSLYDWDFILISRRFLSEFNSLQSHYIFVIIYMRLSSLLLHFWPASNRLCIFFVANQRQSVAKRHIHPANWVASGFVQSNVRWQPFLEPLWQVLSQMVLIFPAPVEWKSERKKECQYVLVCGRFAKMRTRIFSTAQGPISAKSHWKYTFIVHLRIEHAQPM